MQISSQHHAGERGVLTPRWLRTTDDSARRRTARRIGGLTPPARRGFTLVEMLVAMSIIVILSLMTIGAISLGITSERVRGAARQVQSKIEGARDRAIYESRRNPNDIQPVGIRLLVDQNDPTICTSIIYVQSPGSDTSEFDTNDLDADFDFSELALFAQVRDVGGISYVVGSGLDPDGAGPATPTPPDWVSLYSRGLIGPGTRITVNGFTDTIHPASFPITTEQELGTDLNNNGFFGEPVLRLIQQHPDAGPGPLPSPNFEYSLPLNPDIRPDEEPLQLPNRTCIDLATSHLPDGWLTIGAAGPQFSNRMDILFSAKGTVVGEAAAAGVIHLHLVDVADAIENALPGSPTVGDLDGDGTPDDRNGDELGITIFTKSGRVITHPIAFGGYPVPHDQLLTLTFNDTADFDMNPNTKGYWQPSTNYNAGSIVAPRIYNGLIFRAIRFQSGMAGSTAGVEPDWNVAAGGLTRDGQVIWQAVKHNVWALGLQGEVAK